MMAVDPVGRLHLLVHTPSTSLPTRLQLEDRIGSFKFPGCGAAPATTSPSRPAPTSLTLAPNATGTSHHLHHARQRHGGDHNLTVERHACGRLGERQPDLVTTGGSSTLTVNAGTAAAGNVYITVAGLRRARPHGTTVMLTVQPAPPANDFSISANPTSLGGSGTSSISTTVLTGAASPSR